MSSWLSIWPALRTKTPTREDDRAPILDQPQPPASADHQHPRTIVVTNDTEALVFGLFAAMDDALQFLLQ